MLSSLSSSFPDLAAYCYLAYGSPSNLKFGDYNILSQCGPQQGDPLGPLLFCLPLQEILLKIKSPLTLGYLDDLTLGGQTESVVDDIRLIEQEGKLLGLTLNHKKCEVITHSQNFILHPSLEGFSRVDGDEAVLLGAPLTTDKSMTTTIDSHIDMLRKAVPRLSQIPMQDALMLLRASMGHSKMIHILRCSPCFGNPALERYDQDMRNALTNILNTALTDMQWLQATLPVGRGGLGIRRAASLASSAFLASAASTRPLQMAMLRNVRLDEDTAEPAALERWRLDSQLTVPTSCLLNKQSSWDHPIVMREHKTLIDSNPDPRHQARIKAVSARRASDWIFALPISACGLRMDNESVRVSIGLRLGTDLCQPHVCPCGAMATSDGSHGLSCRLGPGRIARHSILNDIIHRALTRAGVPSIKEPTGLSRTDGKRPDGLTLVPWQGGRSLLWDATVTDTMASTYLPLTSVTAGAAAEAAASRKCTKYQHLMNQYQFVPLAFETMGPINNDGLDFICELGNRLSIIAGDRRETNYLFQRLSVAVQRCNGVAFLGTFSELGPVSG